MDKIVYKNVSKSFDDLIVLDDFSLNIEKGDSVVIIGGSGTGKSVSLKCLLGLLTPDNGSIKIDEQETVGISSEYRNKINANIGMLFQNGALFDSMTVIENVCFGLKSGKGISDRKSRKIGIECLDKVGLDKSILDKYPSDLSGGMRKKSCFGKGDRHKSGDNFI